MKSFSNAYIFRFAIIMVVIVAVILTTTATLLKPFQSKNVKIEKMQYIVEAAFADDNTVQVNAENTAKLYEEYIYMELLIDASSGETVSYTHLTLPTKRIV